MILNYKIICLMVTFFAVSLLGTNVYGKFIATPEQKKQICEYLADEVDETGQWKTKGFRNLETYDTYTQMAICDQAVKRYTMSHGDTAAKTISERYGTDIETSYSLKSYCGSVFGLRQSLQKGLIIPAYLIADEVLYFYKNQGKYSPNAEIGFDHFASVFIFVNQPMALMEWGSVLDSYNMKGTGTTAYKDFFKALYAANTKKALDILNTYSQQKKRSEGVGSFVRRLRSLKTEGIFAELFMAYPGEAGLYEKSYYPHNYVLFFNCICNTGTCC